MKVNLKKIGAIVAGATILASSAAFAGLMFGSTTLVDNNGAPVAKVVVGSNAAPSDGVAAALIAGKMVSEAYKSQTLTASISGTASCGPANGSASAGTCPVSNEAVQLEITVPGAVSTGTWVGNNLIGDYMDRTLLDRLVRNESSDTSAYRMGTTDTSDSANPFTNGTGGSLGEDKSLFTKVSGDVFAPFANYPVNDADAGQNYVEKQYMWIMGDNHYDTNKDSTVGNLEFLAYSLKFDGPGSKTLGIPVCTRAESLNFAACKGTSPASTTIDDATETHRVKVSFLGSDWVISEMNAPDGNISSEGALVPGGSIKLAKEAKEGILNQGENLQVGDVKFVLDDLEAHGDEGTAAIFSVLDANGNLLKKDKVAPGATKDFEINGHKYRVHVYKIAPGYTFGAKWADVAIFDQELTLVSGQVLSQDDDNNPQYQVLLGWKNRDAQTSATDPDTLRSIIVYSDSIDQLSSNGDDQNLKPGEYVNLVQDPAVWRLTYKGLDLTSADRDNLKFELQTSTKSISSSIGPLTGSTKMACKIWAPYLRVSSGQSGAFEMTRTDGAASGGTLTDNEFLVALNSGATSDSVAADFSGEAASCDSSLDGTVYNSSLDTSFGVGTIFMRESHTGPYGYAAYAGNGTYVKYSLAGDGVSEFGPGNGGSILVEANSDVAGAYTVGDSNGIGDMINSTGRANFAYSGDTPTMYFAISEKAGVGTSNSYVDYFVFPVEKTGTGSPNDATFDFTAQDSMATPFQYASTDNKILYGHATQNAVSATNSLEYYGEGAGTKLSGPVTKGMEMVPELYTSERGSIFDSVSSKAVNFKVANKLGHAQWMLAPITNSTTSTSGEVRTLHEGESTVVSGVTVKVLQITETVGACSAAGASVACTADMSGVSAMITGQGVTPASSMTVAMPYTGNYDNLVMLDSDAVGVNTLVSVGGDKVNTVTKGLLQGSAVDWSATPKVVREVVQGSKIVVAGKDASDTLDAAKDFVAQVRKN